MLNIDRTKKGFTLVELLVVIAIIALLLSILMPSLQMARRSAYFVICGSNMRQLHLGFTFYANDYNFKTIPGFEWATGIRNIPKPRPTDNCPFTRDAMNVRKVIDSYFDDPGLWKCPADNKAMVFDHFNGSSYAYGWYVLSRKYGHNSTPWSIRDVTSYKLARFNRPAETAVFSHQWIAIGAYDYINAEGIYFPHKYLDKGGETRGLICIYMDGHISKKMTWYESQNKAAEMYAYYLKRYPPNPYE